MTASAEPPEACWLNDSPLPSPPGSAGLSAAATCAEYGRALLIWFTTYERDGFTYRWVGRDDRLGHDVRVRRGEDEPWSVVTMRDWPPAEHDIVVGGWESTREWSAGNCANDVHAAIDGGRLLDAFHAFTLHYRLVRPGTAADAGATFACGLALTSALVDQGYFDLCEWVAARCAELAGRFALGGLARLFLREAAIANENRGLLAAAIHHYEEAIATPAGEPVAEISDLGHEPDVLHRQLHLDFVTTCLSLLADHEPEEFHREPLDQQLIELLHMCQTRLATAERLLRTEAAATSDWARAAARVYCWRVSDLLGDSAQAAEELGRLLAGAELAGHDHLMTTARVFHLAALRKLSENDPAWGHQYDAALRAARTDEEAWPLARACVLWSLSADRLIALGDPAGAFRHAWMALRTHLLQDTRQVQPPRPGETHAGWLAIDVLARLLECHARQAEEQEENLPSILTVLAVESAKGRWFRRDLSRGLRQLPDGGIEYRPTVRGPDDLDERLHRVRTLAEEEWASGRRKPHRQRPRRRKRAGQEFFEAFREPSTAELRRNLPEGSALLSFYAARKRSYVYCLTPDRSLLLRLHTTLPDLNRAALALQAAFSGTGLYGRIDPARPHEADDRLMRPMRELIWQLSSLTAIVRDTPLILISPHRAWHNIPIHALLLPQIWETGRNVALAYVPSLGVAEDLFKRTKNRAAGGRAVAAVASTPRVAAEQHAFHDWHRRIADLLGDACPRVTSVHGAEATADEVVSMASHAELLHVLAHGWYRGDAEIGDSGLVMADGTLTGDALLDGEVTAEHLTLHACSMGRVVTSATDDLWGFARGALLSGIDSVLAPMWDIDLDSSGHLLERFYTHWLAEGRSKVLAFTEAQRELYDGAGQQAWRHQYHWAAFKLLGV